MDEQECNIKSVCKIEHEVLPSVTWKDKQETYVGVASRHRICQVPVTEQACVQHSAHGVCTAHGPSLHPHFIKQSKSHLSIQLVARIVLHIPDAPACAVSCQAWACGRARPAPAINPSMHPYIHPPIHNDVHRGQQRRKGSIISIHASAHPASGSKIGDD